MEELLKSLVELIKAVTNYTQVAAEVKRKELEAAPKERCKIALSAQVTEDAREDISEVAESKEEGEEAEAPIAPAAPEELPPQAVRPVRWIKATELGEMLGVTASCITYNASTGRIPCRRDGVHYYFDAEWFKGKTLADIQCMAATERGTTDKERRWRVTRLLEAPIGKCYTHGTSRGAHFSRMHQARSAGILNFYTLNGVEYINLNEAKRYADWWDREKHTPSKAEAANFSGYKDAFCVHENDLIWLYTKDYNAQLNPTPQQVEDFRRIFKDLRSIQENGVHYYKKDAIRKVETMVGILNHVEFVGKKEDK